MGAAPPRSYFFACFSFFFFCFSAVVSFALFFLPCLTCPLAMLVPLASTLDEGRGASNKI
jgi:hypothetical protein